MQQRNARRLAAMIDYVRDPDEITRRSFAAVRAATNVAKLPAGLADLALRLVHASGDPDLVSDLVASPDAAVIGRRALQAGAAILCDAQMVAHGVTRARLPAGNAVICTLDAAGVADDAARAGITRSAAGVDRWRPHLSGAIVAIGNAPTALFRLLELLDDGAAKPALILGFPVGFIGAAESKAELARDPRGVPFIALKGRRGGSALAAAAVNALSADPPS